MMDPSDTRYEILSLARDFLQSLGVNGFSFQTIADAFGIRKASIHSYFKSKEEMGLALVNDYIEAFAAWAKDLENEPSGLEADERWRAARARAR
jgi:TetR/AcrR family transcriptional repressor of nem operon